MAAFAALDAPAVADSTPLYAYVVGLQRALELKGESSMPELLTPDKIMDLGTGNASTRS